MFVIAFFVFYGYIHSNLHLIGITMPSISLFSGSLQENLHQQFSKFSTESIINRIWEKDYTVWRTEEHHKQSILNRLGWLTSLDLMMANADDLIEFSAIIKNASFTHVVVLGMGGSSLCPDVCRATFGSAPGYPQLLVLDSTNPTSVERIDKSIDVAKTLFIVASKSGGTTETNMFYQYFFDRVSSVKERPGENFIAITDANTKMESIAVAKQFRRIFINPEDIGGRYSALSYFGLVPMALIGMDIKKILRSADEMRKQCRFEPVQNPAAQIGLLMGEAHNDGIDKLTFVLSEDIKTFGYWAEQLIAESTGKEGNGIVPIEGEMISTIHGDDRFGPDRMFVFIVTERFAQSYTEMQGELSANNLPYSVITLKDSYDIGSQFFLWEFATAVSATVLKINPFDEPNVKESKDNTVRVIEEFKKNGSLPSKNIIYSNTQYKVFGETEYGKSLPVQTLSELLRSHFSGNPGEDYISLLAYVDQNNGNENELYALREEISTLHKVPVTIGFGPRYLHSTGQLLKGGRKNGIFLIITGTEPNDISIPGEVFSFETLKQAQALGDYQSFASRSSRMLHLHISGDIGDGLRSLKKIILQ